MAQQHGISELLAAILVGREVALDEVEGFLNPTLRAQLPDPFHLRDMERAVMRVIAALDRGERIAIFGDYDVDGATSTTLLMTVLRALGASPIPYIPDRMREGYGPSIEAFDTLIDQGVTLILTVDCGTMATAPIAHATARGAEVIVLDHHLSDAALPAAYAIVNPNRVDETSPHRQLAAVGVTFLFLVALTNRLRAQDPARAAMLPNLLNLLDLVALGTVCDVMPLTGLNRALVHQGLKIMARRERLGLRILADIARMDEAPNVYHLGFLLGPRINAGGRVGRSSLGVDLLTCAEEAVARAYATELDRYNQERQAIESVVLEQAMAAAAAQANLPVILVAGEGWHAGVIGIVASRLKEEFSRPALVISLEGEAGKGSGRSVTGVDMGAAIHRAVAAGHLEKGGGHAMAAGFSLNTAQISGFHAFLIAQMEAGVAHYTETRMLRYDAPLTVAGATLETLEDIARAGPFGVGNSSPRFVIAAADIAHVAVMKEKHLRVSLKNPLGGAPLAAVAFGAVGSPLGAMLMAEKRLHLLGELKLNRWQGRETPQFMIADAARVVA